MNKVVLVARWEFMRNFKWQQELKSYGVMIVIYLAVLAVQMWNQSLQEKPVRLGVVGQLELPVTERFERMILADQEDKKQFFAMLEQHHLDGILQVNSADHYRLYAAQQSAWHKDLLSILNQQRRTQLLAELSLSQQTLSQLQSPIDLIVVNQAQDSVGSHLQTVGIFAAILSAIAVFTSFGLSLTSVTQEKQQRVTEQLLTCVSHQQWVDGKSIGLCLASLKSLLTTGLFMLIGVSAFSVLSSSGVSLPEVSLWSVTQLLVFSTLGIVFWNYFFVGFSATIDDPNHSGKTAVMLLPILPVFLVFIVMDDPNGQVATVLSMLPLTAISFMPMRAVSMEVPLWQSLLSLCALVAAIYVVRLFATRIFRANITLFGKEPNWSQIAKSMLQK